MYYNRRMKTFMKSFLVVLVLFLSFFLMGCLQSEIVVRVRPDGSGIIHYRWAMKEEFALMIASLNFMGMDEESFEPSPQDMLIYSQDEVAAMAQDFGPGVSFLWLEPLKEPGYQGYVATFVFDDVNTLTIPQDPDAPESAPVLDFVTFEHTRDERGARLTIIQPRDFPLPDNRQQALFRSEVSQKELDVIMTPEVQSIADSYRDMKTSLTIEVLGLVESSNAQNRRGNKIVLYDVDFNRIIEHPRALAAIVGEEAMSISQLLSAVGGAPGANFEPKGEVVVHFR